MKMMTLLMAHILCNEMAAIQILSEDQSATCSANFEQVKISLNPNLTWDEYQNLIGAERSEVSVASFQYYLDWKARNRETYNKMQEQAKTLVQEEYQLGALSHSARD
ncbi:MAG: hypothetical protein KTR18_15825 [Acidiferrobacterales bacterium]|nr:hypothetical protein [Acidiferrobacterales bacterium]